MQKCDILEETKKMSWHFLSFKRGESNISHTKLYIINTHHSFDKFG